MKNFKKFKILIFQIRSKIDWKSSLDPKETLKSRFGKFWVDFRAKLNFERKSCLKLPWNSPKINACF